MKKIKKTVFLYECGVCRAYYSSRKEAEKCENRVLEKKKFVLRDKVSNIEPHVCDYDRKRNYIFKGEINRIIGPMPSDEEYEIKWLGGKNDRLNGHVFLYEVWFNCSRCGERLKHRYFAPELKKIKS